MKERKRNTLYFIDPMTGNLIKFREPSYVSSAEAAAEFGVTLKGVTATSTKCNVAMTFRAFARKYGDAGRRIADYAKSLRG